MSTINYNLYKFVSKCFPPAVLNFITNSPLLVSLKNSFLRSGNSLRTASAVIEFENLKFYFRSPFNVLAKASKSGVESVLCRFFMKEISSGWTCVDVGANYGFLSIIMAKTAQATGKVISFELDETIFNVLKENISKNNLDSVCVVRNIGVSQKPGNDLDVLLSEHAAIHLIKIDTDGSDFKILKGAEKIIQRDLPVIVIEMTENQSEIFSFLKSFGYKYITGMKGEPVMTSDWPPNLIASMRPVVIPKRGFFKQRRAL